MEYRSIRINDLIREVNQNLYLPAIQRELVWSHGRIERLFDSIMEDFPIGSFLFWRLEQRNKHEWPVYEFIREYNEETPHNPSANLDGIYGDISLVLDGQQRITSLFVGLRGSYRYFYYRWRKTYLYLDLLKQPISNDENPEELTYGFAFREIPEPTENPEQLWYPVGHILNFEDAEDAKSDIKGQLDGLTEDQKVNANKLIGRLHTRIHTKPIGNYYEERSQDYDKVLQIFVRANSAGQPLEYSDLLLATATAKWELHDARDEIHNFTDLLNETGNGFNFGKDFVLKACLYLCESLPIQYKVKNFTRSNLLTIERNWNIIKEALATTVRLVSRFGFHSKNIVAPSALLPIAFFLMKRGDYNFDTSSKDVDVEAQEAIRKWIVFAMLKNAFGGASDTTLNRLRVVLKDLDSVATFPIEDLYKSLEIEPSLNDAEIDQILEYGYQGRYTNLIMSLLYPNRYWKDTSFHIDHIFPQKRFSLRSLKKLGYDDDKIEIYMSRFNSLCNLQLLTESENLEKNDMEFDQWLITRDESFRSRHLIPEIQNYGFEYFGEFSSARSDKIVASLKSLL